MPRKRMIDPHIWEDPDFNKLSHQARLLFVGMISNADDLGYLRGDAGSLKRLIFGFDEIKKEKIGEWIQEVKKMRNVHFYEANNEIYAHFLKWDTYQKQQKDRIQASVYPMCSICIANAKQVPTKVKSSQVKLSQVKLSKDIYTDNPPVVGKDATDVELLTDYFIALKGNEVKRKSRYFKVASELLALCNGDILAAKGKLDKLKTWAENNGLEYELDTAVKRYLEL